MVGTTLIDEDLLGGPFSFGNVGIKDEVGAAKTLGVTCFRLEQSAFVRPRRNLCGIVDTSAVLWDCGLLKRPLLVPFFFLLCWPTLPFKPTALILSLSISANHRIDLS